MNSDITTFIAKLRRCHVRQEREAVQLEILEYLSNLGIRYASNLTLFSDAVMRNKEEWYKKSMIECVHQAGREVGYQHEANRVELEVGKALLAVISDMEQVVQAESGGSEPGLDMTPSSTSEPSDESESE